uniref:Uncharacterized protein n=1 Tax=Vitis vinifera TaxID=29760 RepID=A5AT72_VITVI|nr:hypothetical protein VITISV_010672 [Vitis vinifera]
MVSGTMTRSVEQAVHTLLCLKSSIHPKIFWQLALSTLTANKVGQAGIAPAPWVHQISLGLEVNFSKIITRPILIDSGHPNTATPGNHLGFLRGRLLKKRIQVNAMAQSVNRGSSHQLSEILVIVRPGRGIAVASRHTGRTAHVVAVAAGGTVCHAPHV